MQHFARVCQMSCYNLSLCLLNYKVPINCSLLKWNNQATATKTTFAIWISKGAVCDNFYVTGSITHIFVCFLSWLRARPKAERVFAEYDNFLKLSDPSDRDAFQRLISFEPSYRLTNGLRHLKATFNKSFVLA